MARGFLPPGFRFHPTDVELVQYYLKRKVLGKRLHLDAISVVDMYEFPPWDLPAKACLKSRDLQWYFFCPRGRKYGTGQRVNRSTVDGYWKTTGRDRPIYNDSRLVGRKKTLIFHRGRAPHGDRTDWVVHEYRLEDKQLADAGIVQGSYVLCRVFKKSGLGPKNGEQYGAPFIEEEWEDDAGTECCLFATSCSAVNQSPPSDISSRDIQNAQTGYTSNLLDDTSTGDIITQLEQASPPVQGTGTTPLQLELPSIEARTTIQGEDPNMRFLCQVLWEEYDSQPLHCGAPNCELLDPSADKQAFAPDSHDLYTDILDPPAFPNLHPVDDCVPDSSFSNVGDLKGMFSGIDSELEMYLLEENCHPSSGSYVEINDLWGPLDQSSEQPFG